MLGDKIYKPITAENQNAYTQLAIWCNSNNAVIEDKGDYYEACEIPSMTPREALVKERRDLALYLSETDWVVVKCMERSLDVKTEYPSEYKVRGEARTRIDEIDKELG